MNDPSKPPEPKAVCRRLTPKEVKALVIELDNLRAEILAGDTKNNE